METTGISASLCGAHWWMELQGVRVLLLREDSVNLVKPLAIGRANDSEFALTVGRGDTKESGAEVKIQHPVFLQTKSKLRLLGRKRRRRREIRRRRLRRWRCLDKQLGDKLKLLRTQNQRDRLEQMLWILIQIELTGWALQLIWR